jgi:NitT/TauT family transport system substrate-binding protein
MKIVIVIFSLWFLHLDASGVSAQQPHIHVTAGVGSNQLPLYVGKDLGIFEKYGSSVEMVLIIGGARGMAALLGGSSHSANMAAMAPVRAVLAGGEATIVGAFLNKSLQKIVARQEVRRPADLRGKKIGIANFGGSSEFGILLALKQWEIPRESVSLVPAGGSPERLLAMEIGALDASLVSYEEAAIAGKKGMTVLAELSELVPEFPDRLIIVRRSYLDKDRDSVKRFLQGLSEAVLVVRTDRERTIGALVKHLKIPHKLAEENYKSIRDAFSYPPRVGRKGLQGVLDIIQQQTNRPKGEFEMNRFVDESILDELDKEGFFKRLESKYVRK